MKNKLTVSVLFLIISLTALSAASYAWFATGKSVSAKGMAVSVEMPVNVLATTVCPGADSVPSLEGFGTAFRFGSLTFEDGEKQINEYDMLVPVTSWDGIYFAYLPFRFVDPGGYPKANTALSDYQVLDAALSTGYFIDIPLYITTTNDYDLNLYVKSLDIFDPEGGGAVTGAVRAAVIKKEDGVYKSVIYAKDTGAAPLTEGGQSFYPLRYFEGALSFSETDAEGFESAHYTNRPDLENPYLPSDKNSIYLKKVIKSPENAAYHITEARLRVWVEGTDKSAVFDSAGAYFGISVVFAAEEISHES